MDGTYSLNRYAHDMTGMRGLELITVLILHIFFPSSPGTVIYSCFIFKEKQYSFHSFTINRFRLYRPF